MLQTLIFNVAVVEFRCFRHVIFSVVSRRRDENSWCWMLHTTRVATWVVWLLCQERRTPDVKYCTQHACNITRNMTLNFNWRVRWFQSTVAKVSNAGSSAFLFPFSVFFHRGRIAHAAHLPHLPPRTSQTLSSPPPSSRRGSPARATAASLLQNPTSRLPAPTAESSGACCGLCRIHLPSPSGVAECPRRSRGRGLLREPRPPPSLCVVTEGIFPFHSLS
jgi:hypothetical protein